MREYRRKTLLEKGLMPEDKWLSLRYGTHSSERREERRTGSLDVLPRRVKCGANNIHTVLMRNGEIHEMKVRINYSSSKWLYMVIMSDGFVKTVWWKDKKRTYDGIRDKSTGKADRVYRQTASGENREVDCTVA